MKALSVRGDYIMDMISGDKTIEYRSWTTKYRGPILMCSTAKKIKGACPGYALCVANIKKIKWNDCDQLYYWHIEPFKNGGSYLIEPISVKGQLKLFNVDDQLIRKAPYYPNKKDPNFITWWNKHVDPLVRK